MARRGGRSPGSRPKLAVAALVALVALVALGALAAAGPASNLIDRRAAEATAPSSGPAASGNAGSSVVPVSAAPTRSPEPPASPPPSPLPSVPPTGEPSPVASADASAAPRTAAMFDIEGEVIDIGFPLRAETRYRYRDNFLDRREGSPADYNHARPNEAGELLRLHDGTDIYARTGEPVLAPFSGRVIDPATRWTPWRPKRYGTAVVIVSDEPSSAGYATLLVHLERAWVNIGQRVTRGEIIGVLGQTGNAESVRPHLHFELRAPFLLDWTPLDEERRVDAFNPYPSLARADPNR